MLRARLALTLTTLAGVAIPAAAEVTVTSKASHIDTLRTPTCTVITNQEIEKTGKHTPIADVLKTLPSAYSPETPQSCPAPAEKPHSQFQHPGVPSGTFKPMGTGGGQNGPQFPQTPPAENKFSITPSYGLNSFDKRILDDHNILRAEVGVPLLRWDPTLAAHAYDYAKVLAQTGQLAHAPREGRGIERENLMETNVGWSPDKMMQTWTMEKRDFMPGYYPYVARDGNWLNVSHYTQVVWPTTTNVGCGYAEGDGHGWLVCRYSPGGNKDGKPVGFATSIAGGVGPAASAAHPSVVAAAAPGGAPNFETYRNRDSYCSKDEQIEDIQNLQEELINTDQSTSDGLARGNQIRDAIQQVKNAKIDPCAPSRQADSAPEQARETQVSQQNDSWHAAPKANTDLIGPDQTMVTFEPFIGFCAAPGGVPGQGYVGEWNNHISFSVFASVNESSPYPVFPVFGNDPFPLFVFTARGLDDFIMNIPALPNDQPSPTPPQIDLVKDVTSGSDAQASGYFVILGDDAAAPSKCIVR